MAIRRYNKTSPGRRNSSVNLYSEVTKDRPEKPLLTTVRSNSGRNNSCIITTRSRGGGAKRRYRRIDFKRFKIDSPSKVLGIEYDPNRSSNIALIEDADGIKSYILAPVGLADGQTVVSTN